jgi:hypothetical protein
MRSPSSVCVCVCVSVCITHTNFGMPEPILIKLGTDIIAPKLHLNDVIHKSLPSLIPALKSFKYLRGNLNDT